MQTEKSGLGSCASIATAILGLLLFLGFATVYDIIPRELIPQFLQPRSWRESQPYREVDRSDLPLLFTEDFEGEDANQYDLHPGFERNKIEIRNGRLQFEINESTTGEAVQLPGIYQEFSLAFSVYPIGELFDESVNILFLKTDQGWYEFWLRLRQGSMYAYKENDNDQDGVVSLHAEDRDNDAISLGSNATRIQVDVEKGEFTLFINGKKVGTFIDPDNSYQFGLIEIGAGAGDVPGVK